MLRSDRQNLYRQRLSVGFASVRGALIGIFGVLFIGVALLALHALAPCNRYWPQLDYCQATREAEQAELEQQSESEAPPAPKTSSQPDTANPLANDIYCDSESCTQDGSVVAPPEEGSACAYGTWIKQIEGSTGDPYFSCADPDY